MAGHPQYCNLNQLVERKYLSPEEDRAGYIEALQRISNDGWILIRFVSETRRNISELFYHTEWLKTRVQGGVMYLPSGFVFERSEDAMMYRLKFGGNL